MAAADGRLRDCVGAYETSLHSALAAAAVVVVRVAVVTGLVV
jgi:hypothetical protein